jgi:hypothetical protein
MATSKSTAAQAAADAVDTTKDEAKLVTSADALRAPNDPTTDPYHTRGIDPAAAEAGFRAAGYPEKGPLAAREVGDKLALADIGSSAVDASGNQSGAGMVVVPAGGLPNPTADQVGPAGGVIGEGALVDDHSIAAHPKAAAKAASKAAAKPVTTTAAPLATAAQEAGIAATVKAEAAAKAKATSK